MPWYVVRRLLGALPTLFIIVTLAFFMMRVAPGGPFDADQALPAEIEANLRAKYKLDEPLYTQYWDYLSGVFRGDFGPSFQYRDFTVSELIARGFPISLSLGLMALTVAVVVGVFAGSLAALRQNSAVDYSVMGFAMTGISIPNFVVAPLFILIFAVYLGWFPAGGWGSPQQAVMPVIALALPLIAYISRLTRGSMIEVLNSPYIRTARAKGVPEWQVIRRHALRPALLPVVSFLGPATAAVLTGSVVIEQIFGFPGMGRYFVQGALNRDYTLVMGVVIVYAVMIILLNLLVDIVYGWLDPRVRYR